MELAKSTALHIIAPFTAANGGDWQAIDLYLQYSKTHSVTLWAQQPAHPDLRGSYPIQEIRAYSGLAPYSGTLIICGASTNIGAWYEQAKFDKVILFHNLIAPSVCYRALHRLTMDGIRTVELMYVSTVVKQFAGLPGEVLHHIPPIERFKPVDRWATQPINNNHQFCVGRISTDSLSKHHHSDPNVYRKLVKLGLQVRVIGGTCLQPWLGNQSDISLLPTIAQTEIAKAYAALDCFYYRVSSTAKEAYGFVVIEAMLAGLPVVCHRHVGSAEMITHGVNGFVFDHADEAIEIIQTLKNNANLRKEIGINAQQIVMNY